MKRRTFLKLTGATAVLIATPLKATTSIPPWTRAIDKLPEIGKRIAFADRPHPRFIKIEDTDYSLSVGHMTDPCIWGLSINIPLHHEFFGRSDRKEAVITENMMADYHSKDWDRFKKIREQAATLTVGGKRIFANRLLKSIRFKDNENVSHITICTKHENMWWTYIDDNQIIDLPPVPKSTMRKKRK